MCPTSCASLSTGLISQKLTYENGLLKINYTGGDTCHKVYQRSTTIYFYCDRTTQKVSLSGSLKGGPSLHLYLQPALAAILLYGWCTLRVYKMHYFRTTVCMAFNLSAHIYLCSP